MQKTLKENFSVFGRTTLRKFSKLRIYIQGLAKIGPDLVSNLVILSPQLITLHDTNLVRLQDCYNTFHYSREHIGRKTRADNLIEVCHRLNNKVYVDKTNVELPEESLLKYDVIIFCDVYDLGRVMAANRFIRSQKNAQTVLLYACQMGFFGIFLADFGEEWKLFSSGAEFPKIPIKSISSEERGLVITHHPHGYKNGDFILISGVEGMRYLSGDARPIAVVNQTTFIIEDTRSFGTYLQGGCCQKIDLMEIVRSVSMQEQLVNESRGKEKQESKSTDKERFQDSYSELLLAAKGVISFYQTNSRLPHLFEEADEEEAMKNVRILSEKTGVSYEERKVRDVIKTCEYSFYPLIHLFAALVSFEVVKCTGKYRPISEPFVLDWYSRIGFEVKKKVEGQVPNILQTSVLQRLAQLQIGIVDDGHNSVELLNLLYSCSIADRSRVVLLGLESIHEAGDVDPLALKAHIKFQVANDLFKNKKTETLPCSLSFSNDLILSDMWRKIGVLINSGTSFSDYVYSHVIWNQIHIIDAESKQLQALLKVCAAGRSHLRQRAEQGQSVLVDYKACVHRSLDDFLLMFIQIFEDVRSFLKVGGVYMDKVKLEGPRRSLFLQIVCCIEEGGFLSPENIVRICRGVFAELHFKIIFDVKDELVMDYLRALYHLLSYFYGHKEPRIQEINAYFAQNLARTDVMLTQKEKYDIAISKLALGHPISLPYASLSELYRKDQAVKFVWHGSQLYTKSAGIKEDFSSKQFYKHYFRKLKPCPFLAQIINALIPVAILDVANDKLLNHRISMLEPVLQSAVAPPPTAFVAHPGRTFVPAICNEWTIILIEGPKKISQIIDRFNYLDSVAVTRIRCLSIDLYDRAQKKNNYLQVPIEKIAALKEALATDNSVELHIEAEDKQGRACQVSRVKYVFAPKSS